MVAVNAWRGEVSLEIGDHSIVLRCHMDTLAKLIDLMKVETLIEVYQKWDGLNPYLMQKSLELLAENPTEAKEFWKHVNGLEGLKKLHTVFYAVVSGQTPEQIKEAQSHRKKLEAALLASSDQTINRLIEVLPMIDQMTKPH